MIPDWVSDDADQLADKVLVDVVKSTSVLVPSLTVVALGAVQSTLNEAVSWFTHVVLLISVEITRPALAVVVLL